MRARLVVALSVVLVVLGGCLAVARVARASAGASVCPAAAECTRISASRVVASGTTRLAGRSAPSAPYVAIRDGGPVPKLGALVEIPAGHHDPKGFAGVVVREGSAHGLTGLIAVPPLPNLALAQGAAAGSTAGGGDPAAAAAGLPQTLLDLVPSSTIEQVSKLWGDLGCGTGVGEFPIKLTGVSLDPRSFSLTGPTFARGAVTGFGLQTSVSPSMSIQLALKEQLKCEKTEELGATQFPAPGLPDALVRVSGQVSASGSFDGTASGNIKLGTTLSGGVSYSNGVTSFAPAPSVSGFTDVTKPLSVAANATATMTAAVVARLLLFGLWGPRITLSWGPELTLQGTTAQSSNPCPSAKLSFPLRLGVGFGANPGVYYGLGSVAKQLAQSYGAQVTEATFQRVIFITSAHIPVVGPSEPVWTLTKAFDTPNLIEFTRMPIDSVYLPVLPGSGQGASLSAGEQCTTISFTGAGSLTYNNRTRDPNPESDCGGTSTDTYQLQASNVQWLDTWTNTVFGGRASFGSILGSETDTDTIGYDYSGCDPPVDHNSGDPCPANAPTCTTPGPQTCAQPFPTLSQPPTLIYNPTGESYSDHLVAEVNVGLVGGSCPPAFQIGALAGAPLFAVFDLYPSTTFQTTTLPYSVSGSYDCAAVESPPPPPDTQNCTITPSLNGSVVVTGPYTAKPAPQSEQPIFALRPVG